MKNYRLKSGIYFVEGASRGAILDTNTSYVYSVNSEACRILTNKKHSEIFWGKLISMGVAEVSDITSENEVPKDNVPSNLSFVWFEINGDQCNEHCLHCYADSSPNLQGGDVRHSPKMTYNDWLTVINESFALGCKKCQFIGGEPFLYKGENGENVLDLARFAKSVGYTSVEIFTNGLMITPRKISAIKELGIKIALSLYSSNPESHDAITRTPHSYSKTIKAIQGLKDAGVPIRVETVLTKVNQKDIENTIDFKNRLGVNSKHPDPLRLTGRGDNLSLQPDFKYIVKFGLKTEPDFRAEMKKIKNYTSGHSCLRGKIAITNTGEIYPCIFSRNISLGNFAESKNLFAILQSEETKLVWNLSKDNILVCKDCEYRYVCFDCRPSSINSANSTRKGCNFYNAPSSRCTYNPYTGEWALGLWQLDENGNPYYDMEKSALIQKYTLEKDHQQ